MREEKIHGNCLGLEWGSGVHGRKKVICNMGGPKAPTSTTDLFRSIGGQMISISHIKMLTSKTQYLFNFKGKLQISRHLTLDHWLLLSVILEIELAVKNVKNCPFVLCWQSRARKWEKYLNLLEMKCNFLQF
jgi:hypothetical protein